MTIRAGASPSSPGGTQLETLRRDQERRLAEIRDEWTAIGLAAQPAERLRAERGIRAAYVAAGLPPPALAIWVRSPLEGVLGTAHLAAEPGGRLAAALQAAYLDLIGRSGAQPWGRAWAPFSAPVEDPLARLLARAYRSNPRAIAALVDGLVWSDAWRRVREVVADDVTAQVRDEVGWPVRRRVVEQVWAPVCAQIQAQVWPSLKAHLELAHGRKTWLRPWAVVMDLHRLLGVQDALLAPARRRATPDRLAVDDFFGHACGLGNGRLDGLKELARAAGWWWPHRGAVVLCERPLRLKRDEDGRLHGAAGPAVEYPDGWAIWAWHGVRVPRQAIERPESLRAREILCEPDVEVRRALIERLGTDRFLRDAGAYRVAEDETGILWRLDLADDEPLVCVEVHNATPAADATFDRYVLRVPPDISTPREAVAWTFGVDTTDYRPTIET